ncbi:hypothetical protein [Crossiella sp. NPDC003009]
MDRTLAESLARAQAVLAEAREEAEQVVAECQARDAEHRERAQAGAQEMLARIEAAREQHEPRAVPAVSYEPEDLRLYDITEEAPAVPPVAAGRPAPRTAAPRRGNEDEEEDFSEIDWTKG